MTSIIANPNCSVERLDIYENNCFFKAVSCVPVIGAIPYLIAQFSIARKINEESAPTRHIQLIELKNQYIDTKNAACVLGVASGVALIASGIFTPQNFIPIGLIAFNVSFGLYVPVLTLLDSFRKIHANL